MIRTSFLSLSVLSLLFCFAGLKGQEPEGEQQDRKIILLEDFAGKKSPNDKPIDKQLVSQGVFLDQTRVIPASAEWNREIISKKTGKITLIVHTCKVSAWEPSAQEIPELFQIRHDLPH